MRLHEQNNRTALSTAENKRRILKKFRKYLSSIPKMDFLLAIYSIQQIQNSRKGVEKFFIDLPDEARTTDHHARSYLHPWFLETLANELLAAPWDPRLRSGFIRTVNPRSFSALVTAYTLLNKAENASDGPVLRRVGVLTQLNRLGKRQFEWQRRFSTASRLARYHSIYRTENSKIYFEKKYNLEFDIFTKTTFAIFSVLLGQPALRPDIETDSIGITPSDLTKTINILSTSIESATDRTYALRQGYDHIGYAPSIFRVSPLITFPREGTRYVMAPFVDLLFYRITEGLFYDFVDNSNLRNEFAENLENYVSNILKTSSGTFSIGGNLSYGRTLERTPDILVSKSDDVVAAIEVKARRQNAIIRFGENPTKDSADAYEDLAKGVFQLWKYLADSSRGLIPQGFTASNNTALGVCTLDNWIESAFGSEADIYAMAHKKADSHARGIPLECRKHVPIFSLSDMEFVLSRGGMDILLEVMHASATEEYSGWLLSSIFSSKFPSRGTIKDALPFGDVSKHVPWWNSFERSPVIDGG
ncbi:hypothetical protein EN784_31955 [bacterium M00.F.Ca.ET.141.01.1.1]|nr:hypothetical protein EN784_31955 [bacterium M00.F.Ca.ET.141.01.1.1]